MSQRTAKCRSCGDTFALTKEEQELLEDGFCGPPELCTDCYENEEAGPSGEPETFDGDPGL